MTIAKKNRMTTRYSEEVTTFDTIESAPLIEIRNTGATFDYAITGEASNEIRSDRNKTDYAQLGASNSGEVPFELSYGNTDDLMEGALFGDWTTAITVTDTDISALASDNSINTLAGDFVADGFVVGQKIEIRGFTGDPTANNGYFTIVSVATAKIVVSGATLVDDTAGESVTIKNDGMLRNGVSVHSYSFEQELANITKFMLYTGMKVGSMNMTTAKGAKLTGSMSLVGASHSTAGATAGTGGPTAAGTAAIMNSTNNVTNILEAGASLAAGVYITQLDFSVANNLTPDEAIGSLTPVEISEGMCDVTGTATYLLANLDLYNKYINGTASSLQYKVEDSAGNAYIITFPNIEYTAAPISGDISLAVAMTFQALLDTTTSCVIQIDRFIA